MDSIRSVLTCQRELHDLDRRREGEREIPSPAMHMDRTPESRMLADWRRQIEKSGAKSLKRRQLLELFGWERQNPSRLRAIESWFQTREPKLYVTLVPHAPLDETITITTYSRTIGAPVQSEQVLHDRFESDISSRLGLFGAKHEYRPKGSLDKIDVLCRDADGRRVAVEFKVGGGHKRAIEQLLRYLGHLLHEGRQKPRAILITGERDLYTWRALQGLNSPGLIDWWLYGLVENDVLALQQTKIEPPPPKPSVDDIKRQQEKLLREFMAEQARPSEVRRKRRRATQ